MAPFVLKSVILLRLLILLVSVLLSVRGTGLCGAGLCETNANAETGGLALAEALNCVCTLTCVCALAWLGALTCVCALEGADAGAGAGLDLICPMVLTKLFSVIGNVDTAGA